MGAVSYAFRNLQPNGVAGIRTPRTMNDPEAWRLVHARTSRVMPLLSSICCALAVSALWIPKMRTVLAGMILIGAQLLTLLALAML